MSGGTPERSLLTAAAAAVAATQEKRNGTPRRDVRETNFRQTADKERALLPSVKQEIPNRLAAV